MTSVHLSKAKGKYNGYRCEDCGVITLTVDRDAGVTPMFLACRADSDCNGQSISLGYPGGPVPESLLPVRWEWYKPSEEEKLKFNGDIQTHVNKGGLVLRKIDTPN